MLATPALSGILNKFSVEMYLFFSRNPDCYFKILKCYKCGMYLKVTLLASLYVFRLY